MLTAFILASLLLALTPGPGVLYIVTRTLAQGRAAGLASVAGVALGNLCCALGAGFGLAALLALSALAFDVLRYAGAAYLIVLGIRTLRAASPAKVAETAASGSIAPSPITPATSTRRVFRDGLVVAVLNPKTLIFFAAFLPQFIDPAGNLLTQSVLFGGVFVAIAAATDSLYVLAAHAAAPALAGLRRGAALGRVLTGSIFIGLGAFTALSGHRPSK